MNQHFKESEFIHPKDKIDKDQFSITNNKYLSGLGSEEKLNYFS